MQKKLPSLDILSKFVSPSDKAGGGQRNVSCRECKIHVCFSQGLRCNSFLLPYHNDKKPVVN